MIILLFSLSSVLIKSFIKFNLHNIYYSFPLFAIIFYSGQCFWDFLCLVFNKIFNTIQCLYLFNHCPYHFYFFAKQYFIKAKQTRPVNLMGNWLDFRVWIRQLNSSKDESLITHRNREILCKNNKENQQKKMYVTMKFICNGE